MMEKMFADSKLRHEQLVIANKVASDRSKKSNANIRRMLKEMDEESKKQADFEKNLPRQQYYNFLHVIMNTDYYFFFYFRV